MGATSSSGDQSVKAKKPVAAVNYNQGKSDIDPALTCLISIQQWQHLSAKE